MNYNFTKTKDLWQYLYDCGRPVLLYGTGNGADKILDICISLGIEVLGVFASDEFVTKSDQRRRFFREMTILSYSEACQLFSDRNFIILLCFASRFADVIDHIRRIAAAHELYVPDVPVTSGSELFTSEFFHKNESKIHKARMLFTDKESHRIFDGITEAKLNGSIDTLLRASSDTEDIWDEILSPGKYRSYADLGAYNGDTIIDILKKSPGIKMIYAMEPDIKTCNKLRLVCNNLKSDYPGCELSVHHTAAWDKKDILYFCNHGNRGSSGFRNHSQKDEPGTAVNADSLDNILCGEGVDYIKYDVEGAEKEALTGSLKTINRFSPDICLSLYHRSEDFFELPLMLHSIDPEYKLYIRRKRCLPAWELNLYAVKKSI